MKPHVDCGSQELVGVSQVFGPRVFAEFRV